MTLRGEKFLNIKSINNSNNKLAFITVNNNSALRYKSNLYNGMYIVN